MPSTARPAVDERGLAASAAPWRTRAGLGRRHRRDRAGRADGAGAAAAAAVGTASGMGGARALREAAAPGELRLAAGKWTGSGPLFVLRDVTVGVPPGGRGTPIEIP